MQSKNDKLLELVKRLHVVRPRDLEAAAIPRNYLARLVRKGELRRLGRGLYTAPSLPASEHISLLEVSRRAPKAIICLLSALRFHEIGTQLPSEVWIAVHFKARAPRVTSPAIRIVHLSDAVLHFGVEEREIDGGTIRIFSAAKTIADCFKFRHKIGTDIALEALRDCYRQKKASMDELWEAAKVCRMTNVMRPYLEFLP